MNPYSSYLDGRAAVDILRATPSALQSMVAGLSPDQVDTPAAPGKWSIRQILAHLADCEIVWAFRIRQALATPGCTVTPFDQDAWAARYSAYSAADGLRTFTAIREWNLSLLTTVSEEEQSNLLNHPERGALTLSDLLELIAGHDLNHLVRLREQLGGGV